VIGKRLTDAAEASEDACADFAKRGVDGVRLPVDTFKLMNPLENCGNNGSNKGSSSGTSSSTFSSDTDSSGPSPSSLDLVVSLLDIDLQVSLIISPGLALPSPLLIPYYSPTSPVLVPY